MKNIRRIVVKILDGTGNGSFGKLGVTWENSSNGNYRNRIPEIH
jgi:hypothetical protein